MLRKLDIALVVCASSLWAQERNVEPPPLPPPPPAAEHAPEAAPALAPAPEMPPPAPRAPDRWAQARPPKAAPAPPAPPAPPRERERLGPLDRNAPEDALYRRGQRQLDWRDWSGAAESFDAAVAKNGAKADAALYWKAYALRKVGRSEEALAAIAQLEKQHAQSRWLRDARALAIEVKDAAGKPAPPEEQRDEELKLMAIFSLLRNNSDRAVPMLEKVLAGANSPNVKRQAMFVLAQSKEPRAREVLMNYARGASNSDMQMTAVEMLSIRREPVDAALLAELYGSLSDPAMKKRLIHSMFMSKATPQLMQVVRNDRDPALRQEALQMLAVSGRSPQITAELLNAYRGAGDPKFKRQALDLLVVQGGSAALVELARAEKDAKQKREIVHRLYAVDQKAAAEFLAEYLEK